MKKFLSVILLLISTFLYADVTSDQPITDQTTQIDSEQTNNLIVAIQNIIDSTNAFASFYPQNFYILENPEDLTSQLVLNAPAIKKAAYCLIACGTLSYFKQYILESSFAGSAINQTCTRIGVDPSDLLSTIALLCATESIIPLCTKNFLSIQKGLISSFVTALSVQQLIAPKVIAPDECSKAFWRALFGALAYTNLGALIKNQNFEIIAQNLENNNSITAMTIQS